MDRRELVNSAIASAMEEVDSAGSRSGKPDSPNVDSPEITAMREKVAKSSGLSLALAGRLSGTTEAEIKADADRLMEAIRSMPANLHTRPKSLVPTGGAVDQPPSHLDIDPIKLAANIMARRLGS
ncbi:hypothetical protein [Streptomyces sp. NRRL WC-3742]|uniref:hypothetical protein n=1 Tax=Streptomyces sp. NRRL WC-3742 TaxID=1463934 RepID=UPI0004CA43E8|nr:hypothetical protein [Streptomyces sp. NRRL WC-3742]